MPDDKSRNKNSSIITNLMGIAKTTMKKLGEDTTKKERDGDTTKKEGGGDTTFQDKLGGREDNGRGNGAENKTQNLMKKQIERLVRLCEKYDMNPEELVSLIEEYLKEQDREKVKELKEKYDTMWDMRTCARNAEKEYENLRKLFLDDGGLLYVISILLAELVYSDGICTMADVGAVLSTLKNKLYMLTVQGDGGYRIKNIAVSDYSKERYQKHLGVQITDEMNHKQYKDALGIIKAKTEEMSEKLKINESERYFVIYRAIWEKIKVTVQEIISLAESGNQDSPVEEVKELVLGIKAVLQEHGIEYIPYSRDKDSYFVSEKNYLRGAFADSEKGNVLLYGNVI